MRAQGTLFKRSAWQHCRNCTATSRSMKNQMECAEEAHKVPEWAGLLFAALLARMGTGKGEAGDITATRCVIGNFATAFLIHFVDTDNGL